MLRLTLLKIKGYCVLVFFLALAGNTAGHERGEIQDLVEAAKKGDADAFESIYKVYSDNIYRYLYYMMGNKETAYDLTSQVFLKAYENIKSYRFKGYSFSAWLYKIAHNLAIDEFRSAGRRASENGGVAEAAPQEAEHSFEDIVVDRMAIETALRELTKKQRQVMILKYIEQMTNQKIADILGKTTGAVKALERRARDELKKILLRQYAQENDLKKAL